MLGTKRSSQVRFGVSKGGFAVYPVHDAPLDSNRHLSERNTKTLSVQLEDHKCTRQCLSWLSHQQNTVYGTQAVTANSVFALNTMQVVFDD